MTDELRPETVAAVRRVLAAEAEAPSVLRELLLELAEYLGDRPRSDAAAMALYRRVLEMLGEQKP